MKTLLLLRHAKSNWSEPQLADHDRPLNERGRRDATRMGRLLRELQLVPNLILSSTATRARKTAKKAARHCGFEGSLQLEPSLYTEDAAAGLSILRAVPDEVDRVVLVAHNPALEHLLKMLTGRVERMSTATLARIDLACPRWRDLAPGDHGLVGIWRPRELGPER
jgi:phosphohistidine phosphatase